MKYLAVLQTDDYEWICLSDTEAEAKQGVFDGFNVWLMRQFERENDLAIETTHEYLEARLSHYYKRHFGGDVSIDALSKGNTIEVLELIPDACYRDGYKVPRRIQDI